MLFYALLLYGVSCDRPRGVSISKASFYVQSEGQFSCLDGKFKIPYDQVNDDFCDCEDGSDEPGTSACPNGSFHCTNAGFKPSNIFSSRVNDMICDCCDGSDEWAGHVSCPNTCKEQYAKEFAHKIEANKLQALGWEKRKHMVEEAAQIREANSQELSDHEGTLEKLKTDLDAATEIKDTAEAAEETAKQLIEERRNAVTIERAAKYDEDTLARIAFDFLDGNKNGELAQYELTSQKYLDPTPDNSFSHAEAKTMMKSKDKLTFDEFRVDLWDEISNKIIVKLDGQMDKFEQEKIDDARKAEEEDQETEPKTEEEQSEYADEPTADIAEKAAEDEAGDDEVFADEDEVIEENEDFALGDEYDDDYYDEDDYPEDFDDDDFEDHRPTRSSHSVDDEIDEETQKIYDLATEARKSYNVANDKFKELERKVNEIEEQADVDFGKDDVFLTMYKKCYELKTAEYIYSLCPYDKCAQKPINGGAETKLGNWKGFNGDYSEMVFDGGVRCWNGPDRSAKIILSCGAEHKVVSVDEPNRCEYEYKFQTPSVCDEPEELLPPRDEL